MKNEHSTIVDERTGILLTNDTGEYFRIAGDCHHNSGLSLRLFDSILIKLSHKKVCARV